VFVALAQVTAALAIGLAAAWTLRRRPARAHAVLVLALGAALAAPVVGECARRLGLGLLPVRERPVLVGVDAGTAATGSAPGAVDEVGSGAAGAVSLGMVPGPGQERAIRAGTPEKGALAWVPPVPVGAVVLVAWVGAGLVVLVRTVAGVVRAGRVVRSAGEPAPGIVVRAAEHAATGLGVRAGVEVRASASVGSPIVWCWGARPVVVVPAGSGAAVDWDGVMRHELAHWVRRDHLWDAFARVGMVVLALHPLAWVVHRLMQRAAERACDDWAVARGGAVEYAQSLVNLGVACRGVRLALPAVRGRSDLGARVRRVLARHGAVRPRAGRLWLATGATLAATGTVLAGLARQPQADRAQGPAPGVAIQGLSTSEAVNALYAAVARGAGAEVFTLARAIAERRDPAAVPLLIGVIDADNTCWTVYGVGYFGLWPLTGVAYDDRYDGTWWRAWWEQNKGRFDDAARATPVPAFAPTKNRVARVYDFGEWAGKTSGEPAERILSEIERRLGVPGEIGGDVTDLAKRLVNEHGARAIPWLIGVIDADNTYGTIYGVGALALGPITGVPYDDRHDGAWWRAWWEKNSVKFPAEARATPVPAVKRSPRHVASVYDHGQWVGEVGTEPVTRMMDELARRAARPRGDVGSMAQRLAERGDVSVVPGMIALIKADTTGRLAYDVGYFGLGPLTGVTYDASHDGAWWEAWYAANKGNLAGGAKPTPDRPANPAPAKPAADAAEPVPADIADVAFQDILIGGDARQRYFLIGADEAAQREPRGLLVVLPGGDGSADFSPFVRRMWKNALPAGWVVAQAVAPRWRDDADRVVWPTEMTPDEKAAFTTERFLEAIIADVGGRVKVDPARVFALGWSSGGPAVYSAALREGSSLRGAFVAMSVYTPERLPPAKGLGGRSFYVLHSPEDWIRIDFARQAVRELSAGGARATLVEYAGGHGWRGNVWKNIRDGVEWLEQGAR
jgi:beta-lactamase regulating signal transducer with metallopeptidase domain/predicted esterase